MKDWLIKSKKGIIIKTFGESMLPLLHDGDVLTIKKIGFKKIKINDIICARIGGKYVTHRVIYKTNKYLITKGDYNLFSDGKVFPRNIYGRVESIRRGNLTVSVDNLYLFQSSVYFDEIKRITKAFKKNHVDFLILKGLPLHLFFEKKHPRRIYADCDILIDKGQFRFVEKILTANKYQKVMPLSLTGKIMEEKAEISFFKVVDGLIVEFDIHREVVFLMTRVGKIDRLYPQSLVDKLSQKFLKEKRIISVEKTELPILTNENLIIYLLLHIYHHNFFGTYRYDFFRTVLSQKFNAETVLQTIKVYKLWNFLYAALFIYSKFYDKKIVESHLYVGLKKMSKAKFVEKKIMKISIFDSVQILGEGKFFRMLYSLSANPFWYKLLIFLNVKILYSILWVLASRSKRIIMQYFLLWRVFLKEDTR